MQEIQNDYMDRKMNNMGGTKSVQGDNGLRRRQTIRTSSYSKFKNDISNNQGGRTLSRSKMNFNTNRLDDEIISTISLYKAEERAKGIDGKSVTSRSNS